MPASSVPVLAALAGAGTGSIAGSFLATVVLRWPASESAARGRSRCDGCGVTLRAFDLIPIASWAVLRGRCRRCGARIDPLHPAIELAAALIGAIALGVAPGAAGAAGALFGWALLLLAVLDLRHHWLPDAVTLPLVLLGLAAAAIMPPLLETRAIGAAAGYAVLEALRLTYARVRGRAGLGGGDPKLFAAIGAWLGWPALPAVLLGASGAGLVIALILAARGSSIRWSSRVPFGALLAPAGLAAWLLLAMQQAAL